MISRADPPIVKDVPTRIVLGSFSVGSIGGLHEIIGAARNDNPAAVAHVLERVRQAMPSVWPEIAAAVIVPVPGHLPGPPHRLLLAVCEEMASARRWRLATDALQRMAPAPEGKRGRPRDPAAEAATLRFRLPASAHVIVLVDDVVRTGATIRACAEALRITGEDRRVVAIGLARAEQPAG